MVNSLTKTHLECFLGSRNSELFNNHPINGLGDEMRDDQTAIYNLPQIIKFTRNIWRFYALSLFRTEAPMLFVCSHHICFARKCSVLINFLILDIRTQLNEQLRCLDTRLECQQSQLLEIQVWAIINTVYFVWDTFDIKFSGCFQAASRDRAELLSRPGEALQAAQLQAQGAEAEGMWTCEKKLIASKI